MVGRDTPRAVRPAAGASLPQDFDEWRRLLAETVRKRREAAGPASGE